jgi:hypothetical protein
MDLMLLTVYQCPFPKMRIGRESDGGYVIAVIPNHTYDLLLAGGIADDISFEEHFLQVHDQTKCIALDGTVNQLPTINDRIMFIKKNIGNINSEGFTNLHDIIESHKSIFVKMDIEGAEINWLKCLTDDHLNNFDQIVMEFHYPFTENDNLAFARLNKNHALIHFHGNNNCGVRNIDGINIPNVFECTYLHLKFINRLELNSVSIPGTFDRPNFNHEKEIYLNYPPFVFKF